MEIIGSSALERIGADENHKMKKILLVLEIMTFAICINAQGWRGLSPVVSSRSDVELTLGVANRKKVEYERYELDKAIVSVLYSDGKCDGSDEVEWNLKEGTVIALTVIPKEYVSPTQLGFDLDDFIKSNGPSDMPGVYWFTSQKLGIFFAIDSKSTFGPNAISRFTFVPKESHLHLRCKSK